MIGSSVIQPIGYGGPGGGGSPISNPGVAYIRSDGNDGTAEIGNPAKPYLTANAAWADLKTAVGSTTELHSMDFGIGSFTLAMDETDAEAGYRLYVSGAGITNLEAPQGSILTITGTSSAGANAVLVLNSNMSIGIDLTWVGGDGGDDQSGGNANVFSIYCRYVEASVVGGNPGADLGATPVAGTVDFFAGFSEFFSAPADLHGSGLIIMGTFYGTYP